MALRHKKQRPPAEPEGKSLQEAVRFANVMAALTVSGAIPSLHYRAQVEAFMAERG